MGLIIIRQHFSYGKAFDSVGRKISHNPLRRYGAPGNIVNIRRNSYDELHRKVVHGGQMTYGFQVKTGVR